MARPLAAALLALAAVGSAQPPPGAAPAPVVTLDFEGPAARDGWSLAGQNCSLAADPAVAHSGRGSLVIACLDRGRLPGAAAPAEEPQAVAMYSLPSLPVESLRGRRIVVSGFLHTETASAGRAVLRVRIDAPGGLLLYQDMGERHSAGATPWTRCEVAAEVPPDATAVAAGALLSGSGRAWLDDLVISVQPAVPAAIAPAEAPQAVVDWVKAGAIPLAGTSPDLGLDDLAPLDRVVGAARIVGLGEATHGSREFFQLKHRLLEYLVAVKGFTVFAVEAGWPESLAVDDYVMGGRGDAAQALAGFHYWMWTTEEVLDLVRWLRAWNADPRHLRKVHLYGFDAQFPDRAADALAAYLRKVDPDYAAKVAGLLAQVSSHRIASPPPADSSLHSDLEALVERLDLRQAAYAAAGRPAWALARQAATVLVQEEAMRDAPEAGVFDVRDRAMAANVAWLLDREPPGTRMVLWAHNGHVSLRDPYAAVHPLGELLRHRFGTDYIALGFLFAQGSFQALDESRRRESLAERTLGPPPPQGLEAAFARTGLPYFVLDLRRGQVATSANAGPDTTAAGWFAGRHPMREIGAIFTGESTMILQVVLPERFDAVLFVARTTSARQLPP